MAVEIEAFRKLKNMKLHPRYAFCLISMNFCSYDWVLITHHC